ncbi:MAG: hypothetical protein ACLFO2_04840 [Candidatus Woesearchaeota archaeon]
MSTDIERLSEKLDTIKTDLDFIKKRLVDVDTIFTDDDAESLREAEEDYKAGKTELL